MNERPGALPNFVPATANFRISAQPFDLGIKCQQQAIGGLFIVERDIAPNPLEIVPRPPRYDDISHVRPWLSVPLWLR